MEVSEYPVLLYRQVKDSPPAVGRGLKNRSMDRPFYLSFAGPGSDDSLTVDAQARHIRRLADRLRWHCSPQTDWLRPWHGRAWLHGPDFPR